MKALSLILPCLLLLPACAGDANESDTEPDIADMDSSDTSEIQSRSSALVGALGCNLPETTQVALQAANGQYVVAEGGGGGAMNANRAQIGPWETFTVSDLGGSNVRFRTANGKWVVAEGGGGGQLLANRSAPGNWETFAAQRQPDGKFALRTWNGRHYVVAEGGGGGSMNANRQTPGPWEKFTVVCLCSGRPCSANGAWLSGSYENGVDFGNWRGVPVAIVGMGFNNDNATDNRRNITLDPQWAPPAQLTVVESTYSLIDRSRGDTWATAASGALDSVWRAGMQNVFNTWGSRKWFFIRPAHEFNGQELWDVRSGDEAAFRTAWASFYRIVQEELVQRGKPAFVVYDPNWEKWGNGIDVSDAVYPGDAVVDVIGVDYYDNGRARDEASWSSSANETTANGNPRGLYTWQAFARRHNKPFALPEWGLQSGTVANNDNPFFIRKMNEFFRANAGSGPGQVLYEQYFTSWESDRLHPPTRLPNSAAAYKSLTWSNGVGVAWPPR